MGRHRAITLPAFALALALAPVLAAAAPAAPATARADAPREAIGNAGPAAPSVDATASPAPMEFRFTRGDTRNGSRVRIVVAGDSMHYSRISFATGRDPVEASASAPLDERRRAALKRILGDLPRFEPFGSCFGKGMRFYMIDTPSGKLYRSLPELSSRCFADEPDIWPLLYNLDIFISPPDDLLDPEYSTAPAPAGPRG